MRQTQNLRIVIQNTEFYIFCISIIIQNLKTLLVCTTDSSKRGSRSGRASGAGELKRAYISKLKVMPEEEGQNNNRSEIW